MKKSTTSDIVVTDPLLFDVAENINMIAVDFELFTRHAVDKAAPSTWLVVAYVNPEGKGYLPMKLRREHGNLFCVSSRLRTKRDAIKVRDRIADEFKKDPKCFDGLTKRDFDRMFTPLTTYSMIDAALSED